MPALPPTTSRCIALLFAALLMSGLPAPASASPSSSCPPARTAGSVVRRSAPTPRVPLSVCWRVSQRAPVSVDGLSRGAAAVRFTARRRLNLTVKGSRTVTRRGPALRPGRWVAVRLTADAKRGRVELVVNGRVEAVAHELPHTTPRGEVAPSLGVPPVRDAPVAPTPLPEPAAAPSRAEIPPRPFAASSFWNAALPDDVALAPNSDALVSELVRQTRVYNPWLNTTQYSTPVYVVGPDQPTVRVSLDVDVPGLQREWDAVPIPPDAVTASGTDRSMVVWQPSTDRMWEFWVAVKRDDGWHARWGGAMRGVSRNPGHFGDLATAGWGATATGLPLLGGLITIDELRRGRVDHALAIAVPEARRESFVWPAQRTDGIRPEAGAIPEGTRFRLDPDLDVESLPASPFVKMLARAAQEHGMVVRDTAGSVALFGEDPTPTGSDPWSAVWQGGWPNQVLRGQFPWSRLQVVDPGVR